MSFSKIEGKDGCKNYKLVNTLYGFIKGVILETNEIIC